jgi:ribosomal protein S18 acetylase RimI-like enzyme
MAIRFRFKTMTELRPAVAADAPRIHAIHTASVRQLCLQSYGADIIEAWLAHRRPEIYLGPIQRGSLFVAVQSGRVIGFGEARPGFVIAVYVDPAASDRGVGRAILRRALEIAKSEPSSAVKLQATLNAQSFYERFGFREVGRTTAIRNRVAIPVVTMQYHDPREAFESAI